MLAIDSFGTHRFNGISQAGDEARTVRDKRETQGRLVVDCINGAIKIGRVDPTCQFAADGGLWVKPPCRDILAIGGRHYVRGVVLKQKRRNLQISAILLIALYLIAPSVLSKGGELVGNLFAEESDKEVPPIAWRHILVDVFKNNFCYHSVSIPLNARPSFVRLSLIACRVDLISQLYEFVP